MNTIEEKNHNYLNTLPINELVEALSLWNLSHKENHEWNKFKVDSMWYRNRFVIPHNLPLKEYKILLKETKEYINYHKGLYRKNPDNFLAKESFNGYINKENTLKKKIKYMQNMANDQRNYTVEKARSVPIDSILDFDRNNFTVCIFHKEKTPSLKYYPKTNKVHCFGSCGRSYDAIDIIQKINNCDFISALKILCHSK